MEHEPTAINKEEFFMREALKQAQKAFDIEEVPIGAVIVCNDKIIAKGHNFVEKLNDATAHAEMVALTSAFEYLGNKYLPECTLYVTLEPCLMCATAMKWAQLGGLIFGAADLKNGFSNYGFRALHKQTKIKGGLLNKECSQLLTNFFEIQRSKNDATKR